MKEIGYQRQKAADYAQKWAMGRNPQYLDFEHLGGDCTNFASQCILAGCGVMNYTPTFGWYYNSSYDRTPSWSGVEYLYNFLTKNRSVGPYAAVVEPQQAMLGDLVQLGDENGHFYHSPVITGITAGDILVAAHSFDAYMRPLSSYIYHTARFLHILGARKAD